MTFLLCVSPITILFFQQLCRTKIDWDDPNWRSGREVEEAVKTSTEDLTNIVNAYAAMVYMRLEIESVRFTCAKQEMYHSNPSQLLELLSVLFTIETDHQYRDCPGV